MKEQAKVRVTFVAIGAVLCVWLVVMTLWATMRTGEKPEPKPAITEEKPKPKPAITASPPKRVQRTRTKRKLPKQAAKKETAKPPARKQTRKEFLREQFSWWDGSHRGLTKFIKESMNDPKSYKHVETTYWDRGDYLIVVTTFRGKNAFGGVVKNSVGARVDLKGNVISIIQDK